jgi:hypothetical protein
LVLTSSSRFPLFAASVGLAHIIENDIDSRLDLFDEFRSTGIGSAQETGDWMRQLSELLTAPPAAEISRIANQT